MPDIALIGSILGSIKTATDIAKIIKESNLSLEKAEVNYKLAELIGALAEAKLQVAEVQEALIVKGNRIRELEATLEVRERLTWDPPYYWLDEGGKREGPYCQQCYDSGTKRIRLQGHGDGSWICRTCENHYFDKIYRDPRPNDDYDVD